MRKRAWHEKYRLRLAASARKTLAISVSRLPNTDDMRRAPSIPPHHGAAGHGRRLRLRSGRMEQAKSLIGNITSATTPILVRRVLSAGDRHEWINCVLDFDRRRAMAARSVDLRNV
jgi:hypothetical protein